MLALLASAFIQTGCSTTSKTPSCCAKEVAADQPVSDKSLFQLDSTWTNDKSRELKLGALRGRPLVVTMFFAKCEYACPVLVHDMKKVEGALPENVSTNIGFVLVSFDTERGTPDDVLELAALLGVKFKKDARGQFAHSNILTVLNSGGEVAHQQIGLNQPPDETVKHLVQLLHP